MSRVAFRARQELASRSSQLRVLRLGLLQDGDVGVGVFPKRDLGTQRLRAACAVRLA